MTRKKRYLYSFKCFSKFCPSRWSIIRIIGEGEKETGEILEGLKEAGETLARSSLYYHLSELEEAGIIEMASYKEEGGGAPEKIWRLRIELTYIF